MTFSNLALKVTKTDFCSILLVDAVTYVLKARDIRLHFSMRRVPGNLWPCFKTTTFVEKWIKEIPFCMHTGTGNSLKLSASQTVMLSSSEALSKICSSHALAQKESFVWLLCARLVSYTVSFYINLSNIAWIGLQCIFKPWSDSHFQERTVR